MEKCYDYLGCQQEQCIMHGNTDPRNCWEVEGTLCNHPGLELLQKMGKNKCQWCVYYKVAASQMMDDSGI